MQFCISSHLIIHQRNLNKPLLNYCILLSIGRSGACFVPLYGKMSGPKSIKLNTKLADTYERFLPGQYVVLCQGWYPFHEVLEVAIEKYKLFEYVVTRTIPNMF